MATPPLLTEEEWQLVRELLEGARRDLPSEIRHTDTARVRHELQERLHTVESLLARIPRVPVGV